MPPDLDTAGDAVQVQITAHGWLSVQRIVVLLSGRGYAISSFEATPSMCQTYWQVRVVLRCPPTELPLLQARLVRLVSVTAVRTSRAPADCGGLGGHPRQVGPDGGATGAGA